MEQRLCVNGFSVGIFVDFFLNNYSIKGIPLKKKNITYDFITLWWAGIFTILNIKIKCNPHVPEKADWNQARNPFLHFI